MHLEEWFNIILTAVVGAFVAATGWLIRKVLTNDTEVRAIKENMNNIINNIEKMRTDLREDIRDVKEDVKDILFHLSEKG